MLFYKFEFKYKDKKLYVYSYSKIIKFKAEEIIIEYELGNLSVKGNKIIIQELFKEYLVINGDIKEISLIKDFNNDRS